MITQNDSSPTERLDILKKLAEAGVRKVSLVGGEPLLVDDLPLILSKASSAGLITSLVTNASLLAQRWHDIRDHLRWITLPLDGADAHTQREMSRMDGHFERILGALSWLAYEPVAVKINTVVSAVNVGGIGAIAQLLVRHRVRRWKLFQFLPVRGIAQKNEGMYSLKRASFLRATRPLIALMASHGCNVTIADHEYLQRNYFSISPDSSVRVTVDGRDVIVGHLKTDTVEDIWSRPEFDHNKHLRHRSWLVGGDLHRTTGSSDRRRIRELFPTREGDL